jgi:hypothetical protein
MGIEIEFIDRVTDFASLSGYVNVLFEKHAANYMISIGNENFSRLVADLADAWKSKRATKITVQAVEIISIDLL